MAEHHQIAISYIKNNQWQHAHELIQQHHDPLSARIHGYLHWQEGDLQNADYWYRRAGQTRPQSSIKDELIRIAQLVGE